MTKYSYLLTASILFLFAIGLVMVFNTTSAEFMDKGMYGRTHQALYKQILYSCMGASMGFILFMLGRDRFIKLIPFLFYACAISLALVFVPGIGQQINGAKRWIGFAGFSLQPSEFAKYIFPFYFIYQISKMQEVTLKKFLRLIGIIGVPLTLILIEPDNGTTAIILFTMMILFILTRIKWLYWTLPLAFVVVCGGIAAYNMPHVPDRIRVYLHPETDLQGKGHQPYQAKIAAGSGGLWGRGLGESLQKMNYLPEARSDYIAAIYAEEMGFFGIGVLILTYMIIAFSGFQIASHSKDHLGFYMAAVITFLITFQAFLNLGVVSNLLPSKGTTLPFISQGGSSLIANTMAFFLLLSMAAEPEKKRAL